MQLSSCKSEKDPATSEAHSVIVSDVQEISPVMLRAKRSLQLKADFIVCLSMAVVYGIQFGDRTSTSNASLMGIREDLNMDPNSQQYSFVGSSFYFGYLGWQIFGGNYLMQRVPIGKTLGIIIVLWGVITCCLGAAKNYASFIALRVIQGFLEGSVIPSFVVLNTQWFPRSQHNSRTSVWYSFVGLFEIMLDGLSYGLYKNKSLPMASWRLQMVILGAITILIGAIFGCIIPNTPREAFFLNEAEKEACADRIPCQENYEPVKASQIKEAFLDIRSWIYIIAVILTNIPSGGVTNFSVILLSGMGFSDGQSILMDMPAGGVELVFQILVGIFAASLLVRYRLAFWGLGICGQFILCLCFLAWGNTGMQLFGYYAFAFYEPQVFCIVLSLVQSDVRGRTKKSTVSAMVSLSFAVGCLVGPQAFKGSEEPSGYPTAKTTMAACSCIVFFLFLVLLFLNLWENKRRDRTESSMGIDEDSPAAEDLTDREIHSFRYSL